MFGLDFGGYTEWERPALPPIPIDFVLMGVAWGDNPNHTVEVNIPAVREEKRPMTYGFYHGYPKKGTNSLRPEWNKQADLWMELSLRAKSKALFIDFEGSAWSNLKKNQEQHMDRFRLIFEYLEANFSGRVGFYCGYSRYVTTVKRYWPGISEKAWWIPWPKKGVQNQPYEVVKNYKPGNLFWYQLIKPRTRNDYIFDQYSWQGGVPVDENDTITPADWGIVNNKKAMDMNVLNPAFDLDKWLGISDEPEPPTPPQPDPINEAEIRSDEREKVKNEAIAEIEKL